MEGATMELGREEKSRNGLWAALKWRNTGGDEVGFLQFSTEGLAWYMEETLKEEEAAMVGEAEREGIRVV